MHGFIFSHGDLLIFKWEDKQFLLRTMKINYVQEVETV